MIKSIEYIEIGGLIRFRVRNVETLAKVLEDLKDTVIVLDEVQELNRLKIRFDSFLAYVLDNLSSRIVVSGSQVGMLHRFLKIDNPEAPLYGRPYRSIELKPLSHGEAIEFLREGFEQEGIKIDEDLIKEAVNAFNGVIGWLTYFGYNYVRKNEDLNVILDKASKLTLVELRRFLQTRGIGRNRYIEVLKALTLTDKLS